MSGHKKARYERKQKFVNEIVAESGQPRWMAELFFDIMYTNKYIGNDMRNQMKRRTYK